MHNARRRYLAKTVLRDGRAGIFFFPPKRPVSGIRRRERRTFSNEPCTRVRPRRPSARAPGTRRSVTPTRERCCLRETKAFFWSRGAAGSRGVMNLKSPDRGYVIVSSDKLRTLARRPIVTTAL